MRDQTRKHIAGVGDAGLLVLSHDAGRHVLRDQRLPNLPRLAASGPYRRGRAFPRIKRISLLVSQALALGAGAFLSPLASWAGNVDVAAGTGLQTTLGNAASGDTVTLTTDNGTYTTNIVNIRSATLQLGAGVTSARITGNLNNSTMEPVSGAPQTLTVQVNGGQTLQMETTLRDNNANILSVTKTGTGTLNLQRNASTVSSYSGATTISAGTLRLTGLNAIGDSSAVFVATGATFDLNGSTETVGNLSGEGSVTLGAGALTLNQSTASTFSGVMSGSGSLTKAGSGKVTLTGASNYTGATTINAGTLAVNGSITSPVTINNGGSLGGSGIINGAVTTASGGILAPGNSIGTLTVNGQLSFSAGSIYRVEVDAAGNNDRINVTGAPGTASLGGATVDVQAGAGSYRVNTRYTLLNATGGVIGTFGAVTSSLAFLTPSLAYDANNVFLSLVRNQLSFADAAATPNQRAAATILQASAAGATGDMETVVNAVTGLSTAQAQSAFDAVGGTSLSAMQNAGAAFAGGFGQQIQRRLGTVSPATGFGPAATFGAPLLLADNQWQADGQVVGQAGMGAALDNAQRAAQRDQRGFWVRAYGAERQTDSDGNAPGNRQRGKGLSLGVDTELREGLVIGAALSGGESRVSVSGRTDAGRSRGTGFGVYGSYAAGPWTFKGLASLASNTNHMDRAISFGGLARTASSDFDSRAQSLYAEISHDLPQGSYLLQPLAALSYVRTKTDGFTETGAGALNLQVASQSTRSARTLLGAKTVHQWGKLTVEPRLTWAHEFGNVNAPLVASFTGAAGAGNFQISGTSLKRDSLALGLGVSGQLRKGFTLTADAQWEGNTQQRNLALLVALRGAW